MKLTAIKSLLETAENEEQKAKILIDALTQILSAFEPYASEHDENTKTYYTIYNNTIVTVDYKLIGKIYYPYKLMVDRKRLYENGKFYKAGYSNVYEPSIIAFVAFVKEYKKLEQRKGLTSFKYGLLS